MKKFILGSLLLASFSFSFALTDDFSTAGNDCINLQYNLSYRSRDAKTSGEVSLLQDFLSPKYLSSEPTGFFGVATLSAVRRFQFANNIDSTGRVGPLTRNKIKEMTCTSAYVPVSPGTPIPAPVSPIQPTVACTQEAKLCPDGKNYVGRAGPYCEFAQCPTAPSEGVITPVVDSKLSFSYSRQQYVSNPLAVVFTAGNKANGGNVISMCDQNSLYSVDYGNGKREVMFPNAIAHTFDGSSGVANSGTISSPGKVECDGYLSYYTYGIAGTYTAKLLKTVYNDCKAEICATWASRTDTVAEITVTVGY